MKKFLIISIILVLIAAGVFGISVYHFIDDSGLVATDDQQAPTQAESEKKEEEKVEETQVDVEIPAQWQDNGIFSKNYEKAYAYVQSMTTENMVGQMLVGFCPNDDTAESLLKKYALSGYVYSADDFTSMDENDIKSLIDSYQKSASTPMIMAVKEEGGSVTAISDLDAFTQYDFSSPRDIFAQGGIDAIKDSEREKAQMLSSVGINLNLAPVCDMAEEMDEIMYTRSLGGTVEETSEYAQAVTSISQGNGVSVALKHFPGYGTNKDTIEPIVVDDREVSVFDEADFKPFEAGIKQGAHLVMVSNVLAQKIDPTCVASLSDYTHTILRNELDFTGLIITDNLNNADYSEYSNDNDVYVQAVLAGNDLILVENIEEAYMAILDAVKNGDIEEEMLQKACMRVIAYKYTAGIMK